jgi:hypothetical protein
VSEVRPNPRFAGLCIGLLTAGAPVRAFAADPSPRDIVERSVKAYNKHDAETIASLFEADATLWNLGVDQPAASGRDGVRQLFLAQFHDHPEARTKAAQVIELGPWVGVQQKTTLEPGESPRDAISIYEVLGGRIRRAFRLMGQAEEGMSGGGEGPVALSIEKWNEGDLPRLMATYDEGATISLLSNGERLAAGEEALRDRFEKEIAGAARRRIEVLQRMAAPPWVVYRERIAPRPEDGSGDSISLYEVRDNLIRRVWIAR